MKHFTQSGAISITEFSANTAVTLAEGTGISIVSATTTESSTQLTTYTVSASLRLTNITDVNLSGLADAQILSYDETTETWLPIDNTLLALSDTNLTSLVAGNSLIYTGTEWINSFPSVNTCSDVLVNSLQNDEILLWDSGDNKWKNSALSLNLLEDVVITSPAQYDVLYFDGTNWINQDFTTYLTQATINTTVTSNTSSSQQYLQSDTIDSTDAVNGNIFQIEAHIDVTHTSDNTEEVHIKLDNLTTLASVSITSGDTWKVILKAELTALTGDTAIFTEETKTSSGRDLENTTTSYFSSTSFDLDADHSISVWVDPGSLGRASTISCSYFRIIKIR